MTAISQAELYAAAAKLQALGITPTGAMNRAWVQLTRDGTAEAHSAMPVMALKNYLMRISEVKS